MNRRSHWITHLFDGLIAKVGARVTYILLDQLSSSQHVKPDILPVLRLERQLWISRKGRAPSSLSTSSRCRLLWCCQNCSIPSCQHTNTNGDVGHPLRAYMLSKTICMRPLGDSAPLSTYLMRRFSPHEATLEAPSSTKVNGDCPTAALVLTFRLSTPSRRVHPSTRRSSTRRHLGQCASRLDFPVYYMRGHRSRY